MQDYLVAASRVGFASKKKKILYAALVNGRIAVANDVSFFPPQKNLKNILKIVKW